MYLITKDISQSLLCLLIFHLLNIFLNYPEYSIWIRNNYQSTGVQKNGIKTIWIYNIKMLHNYIEMMLFQTVFGVSQEVIKSMSKLLLKFIICFWISLTQTRLIKKYCLDCSWKNNKNFRFQFIIIIIILWKQNNYLKSCGISF